MKKKKRKTHRLNRDISSGTRCNYFFDMKKEPTGKKRGFSNRFTQIQHSM